MNTVPFSGKDLILYAVAFALAGIYDRAIAFVVPYDAVSVFPIASGGIEYAAGIVKVSEFDVFVISSAKLALYSLKTIGTVLVVPGYAS
ncbi:hypothetical protein AX279_13440 [Pseudomonas sp. J237]|nr:hypothetical protein AX279_13440 [Pseudomonas sp. J237]